MKKYLILSVVPGILMALVVGSVLVVASRMIASKHEKTVQYLTKLCVEHGMVPSSSVESGFLSTHVRFSCVKKLAAN